MSGHEDLEKGLRKITTSEAASAAESIAARMDELDDSLRLADEAYDFPFIAAIVGTLGNDARKRGKTVEEEAAFEMGALQALYALVEVIELEKLKRQFST